MSRTAVMGNGALGSVSRRQVLAGALGALTVSTLTGCASLDTYRDHSVRLQSRFSTIESFGVEPIDPGAVDELLLDVAHLLGVKLDPVKPRCRILVTRPSRIDALYSDQAVAAALPGHAQAIGLYFPQASLVLVPRFDRALLGHELAHYVTHHYLKDAPRSRWEWIASGVENRITAYHRPASAPPSPRPALPCVHASVEGAGPASRSTYRRLPGACA